MTPKLGAGVKRLYARATAYFEVEREAVAQGDSSPEPPRDSDPTPDPDGLDSSYSPGDLLAARFRIVSRLGKGGMGEVFEAEDLELGERVAIKLIRLDLAHDSKAAERFRREIHLARQVTHPNVCRVYDVFRHQGEGEETVLLSMELLEGIS